MYQTKIRHCFKTSIILWKSDINRHYPGSSKEQGRFLWGWVGHEQETPTMLGGATERSKGIRGWSFIDNGEIVNAALFGLPGGGDPLCFLSLPEPCFIVKKRKFRES